MDKPDTTRIESNQSEVARIRQEIALAMQACERVFKEPAITSPHQFITKRMEHMQKLHDDLVPLVGELEATKITIEAIEGRSTGESL